jgi:hypothetical protein
MSDWNEIKRPFREALIAAFNRDRLAIVLQYHCDRRLDRITSKSEGFEKNVDDVIEDAVRNGWLEKLAQGALAENELHTALKATVPSILDGVAAEGIAYYQGGASGDFDLGDETEEDNISIGSITADAVAIGRGSSASVGEKKSEAVDSKSSGVQAPDVRQLQRQLVDQFNLAELQDLCFSLEVEFEDLAGSGKSAKARELVLYMQRRGQLDRLVEAIQELR